MEQIKFCSLIVLFIFILSATSAKESYVLKLNINKCCSEGEYMYIDGDNVNKCTKLNNLGNKILDFSDVPLYNRNKIKTGKNVRNVYNFVYGVMYNDTFKLNSFDYSPYGHNYYLSEEGILFEENPNQYSWWTELPSDNFCIDYKLDSNASVVLEASFWSILDSSGRDYSKNILYVIGLFISCFFLALVFLVKFLLPGSWGLSGMVQMSYVISTFVAFFFLALNMTPEISFSEKECIGMTYVIYYFTMASFNWMVAMSYDLWRLHSNCNLNRSVKRKVLRRYSWYSAGAWGVPLALTVFLIATNHMDLRHIPWFIQPNIGKYGCFLYGGEQLLYMYIPMSILILINWVFFCLTSYNLWTQYRETSALDTNNSNVNNNHRSFKNRFCVYLKLSIVSGISWILEMASSFNPNFEFWYITDCYNMLTGLSIFIILVCNKRTYKQLQKRFGDNISPSSGDSVDIDNIS